MSYILNLTNGNVLTTLQDGTTNTSTGLTLIGRNFPNYGDAQNQNFVKLLENFSDSIPPTESSLALDPLVGTIWYDNVNQRIRVYDGTNWSNTSERIVSNTAPTSSTYTIKVGDQWWDTVNLQLNTWNGSAWQLVGPSYTAAQGRTGLFQDTVTDTVGQTHSVTANYVDSTIVSVVNLGTAFTVNSAISTSYTNFGPIGQGVTFANSYTLTGTATNSLLASGINPGLFARTDQTNTFTKDVTLNGVITFGTGNISYANNALVLQNKALNGNFNVYANSSTNGNINVLHIDGNTGLATIYSDPVTSNGIATKNYVDNTVGAQASTLTNIANEFLTSLNELQVDYIANVSLVENFINSVNSNVTTNQYLANTAIASLSATTAAQFTYANAITANLQSQLNSTDLYLEEIIPILAPLNSAAMTGNPTVPMPPVAISYATSIGSSSYLAQYTQPITVSAGQYIVQIDSTSGVILSNVKSLVTTTDYYIHVQLISGSVTNASSAEVFVNGILAPSTKLITISSSGNQPVFMGLNDTYLGQSGGTSIATTGYVDLTANLIYNDYTVKLENLSSNLSITANSAISVLAPLAAPVFTLDPTDTIYPQSVTPPPGDDSTNIATTAFVQNAVSTQQFNYTVSANPPSGGNDGDFWFQIG